MKHFAMVLYGEPGTGKSVFACKAPKPFFICTDGNYEYLEDFGAKEEDHAQVSTWAEAKTIFARDFKGYDTIVVDLTEDLFKWCEYEYCARNKFEHVGDIGFGKGYDITRNEFFIELCKLLSKEKNVIFIMHGITTLVKDRRGVEHTKYTFSSRLPDKVADMIEGRVRYFLRCYVKGEEQEDGKIIKRRYLSLIPKENEFGIARGLDESRVPSDIPLDFSEFAKWIGLDMNHHDNREKEEISVEAKTEVETKTRGRKKTLETKETPEQLTIDTSLNSVENETKNENVSVEVESKEATTHVEETVNVETPVQEVKKELSNEDKLAAIRAKLAAINAKRG